MTLHRKTLVLLHGHGVDDTIWEELDVLLNEYYTVVRPNLSLYTSCKSVEDYAEEVHRLITNANITKCTLIGHSMGGYIALAFAEKYPDMLEGFGLFHSTAYADDDAKKEQRNKMADLLGKQGAEAFLRHTGPSMFGERFKELAPERVASHVERFGKLPPEALAAGIEAMRDRPDRTQVLSQLPFPILFIIGMRDQLVPFEKSIELAEFPAKGYPFILAEAGHMGMIERPDASSRIIRWYLDKF
ncbi:alpha/beta hydrolase [Rhabdobacter roseus]|uniref:Pimeloyl-ACP methyl ester carboxylesterase n=1 Tax=Rhabdobacter roseus TaxID=1655419 RepID=A0A840TV07_9BACT|nr:alpha/beta hydrolase [Rhabdobacter roseus]MBB5285412.1 pimeloyl-ACP methyl ester carboxylesterase [Rhabdobacter roseus]